VIKVIWWTFVTGFVLGMIFLALILVAAGAHP
jgi:hypothetical protein